MWEVLVIIKIIKNIDSKVKSVKGIIVVDKIIAWVRQMIRTITSDEGFDRVELLIENLILKVKVFFRNRGFYNIKI